jgi:adenine-specific DNA-methyltransferase
MQLTDYHAAYFASELTKRCATDSLEKLAGALVDAQVDLNPHQIDAALFAFRSPLSRGALLADEVGLGKTIEAGLVLSQRWAERRRHVLVITPANLRKQWHQELSEKFFLPCEILESGSYNHAARAGRTNPFASDQIVICSYQFARVKADDLRAVPWDLVVIDEAHRLRNVYKPTNVIARTLKDALDGAASIAGGSPERARREHPRLLPPRPHRLLQSRGAASPHLGAAVAAAAPVAGRCQRGLHAG